MLNFFIAVKSHKHFGWKIIMKDQNILLGITGGIAAYKSADLTRRLREAGANVRVVMTCAAKEFITPLTMQAVSGNPVHHDLLDPNAEAAMGHIELARWADYILIAPASADFMAKLAHGFADNLLSTLCLASTAPIVLAPAMNQQMWLNHATQANYKILLERGINIIGPAAGEQACGEVGVGRMLEPHEIVTIVTQLVSPKLFNNKRILITAGPTQESIDPVRYITNHSSGKMGYAIAQAAVTSGANVTLISGPVNLTTPNHVNRIDVKTAKEMQQAVLNTIGNCDIFISVAAVADYHCKNIADKKIKKTQTTITLELERNPDILAMVASLPSRPYIVGFAAETDHLIENAENKLQSKKIDMIVANLVSGIMGFNSNENQLTVIWPTGQKQLPLAAKKNLAHQLIHLIAEQYYAKNSIKNS